MTLAVIAAFAAVPSQAGPLEDRIDLLSKQVIELQNQVSQLRSMLNRDSAGNVTQKAANNLTTAAAREILLQAGDQITLKTGSASIVMRKSGEITITGTTIGVLGSGDVVLKGSKVLTN